MNKYLVRSAIVLGLTVILSACQLNEKPKIVYKVVDIPSELLKPCKRVEPPTREEYMSLEADERENKLATLIIDNYKVIQTCNQQLRSIESLLSDLKKGVKTNDQSITRPDRSEK